MLPLMIMISGFAGEPQATAEDYQLYLTKFDQLSEKLFDSKSWGTFELIEKKTNAKRPISSLSRLEMRTSIIVLSQQISLEMARIQKSWENELDLYKNPEYRSKNPKVCKPAEIESYVKKLVEIRKKMAGRLEEYLVFYCKEFVEEVTEPELKVLARKVREFHDAYNLLQRNKE